MIKEIYAPSPLFYFTALSTDKLLRKKHWDGRSRIVRNGLPIDVEAVLMERDSDGNQRNVYAKLQEAFYINKPEKRILMRPSHE